MYTYCKSNFSSRTSVLHVVASPFSFFALFWEWPRTQPPPPRLPRFILMNISSFSLQCMNTTRATCNSMPFNPTAYTQFFILRKHTLTYILMYLFFSLCVARRYASYDPQIQTYLKKQII
ncbi:hypothetical protein BX666DRAFT_1651789 [Dichotomocladium elegans]|nr:hypothetical protein BX666DRAFT_1651789 [Dichotomocladium elegans]